MIIVDTGFWLALANKKDTHHALAVEVFAGIQEPLITTWGKRGQGKGAGKRGSFLLIGSV